RVSRPSAKTQVEQRHEQSKARHGGIPGISILCLLTLFGPHLVEIATNVPSAPASICLAASPISTHFGTAPREARVPVRTILLIATPIFGGLLIVILSTALDMALFKEPLLMLLLKRADLQNTANQ